MTDQFAIWHVYPHGNSAYRIECLDAAQRFYDTTAIPFDEIEAMIEEHGRVDGCSTFDGSLYTLLPVGVNWTPATPEPTTPIIMIRTR